MLRICHARFLVCFASYYVDILCPRYFLQHFQIFSLIKQYDDRGSIKKYLKQVPDIAHSIKIGWFVTMKICIYWNIFR